MKRLFFACMVIFAFASFAFAVVNMTDCGNLGVLGMGDETYVLQNNVNSTGSNACFMFQHDNTTLDCQGFNVTGDGNGAGIGVYSNGFSNGVIENCNFDGYLYGLYLSVGSNLTVMDNNVRTNISYAYTARVDGITNSTFVRNRIFSDVGSGGGANIALVLFSSSYNTFRNNVLMNAFPDWNPVVSLDYNSIGNVFDNNTIYALGPDISISNYGSPNNLFVRNNITGSAWLYNAYGCGNDFNDSVNGNIWYFANGTPSWQVFSAFAPIGSSWATLGFSVPFSQQTLGYSLWSDYCAYDWHPYTENTYTPPYLDFCGCGTLGTSDMIYRQTCDINSADSTCLSINANNITLDCQGYYIDGGGVGYYGINIWGGDGIRVVNCNVTGWSSGIGGWSGSNVDIINSRFADGSGVYVGGMNNLTISNVYAEGIDNGIYIGYSNNVSVINSVGNASSTYGIVFDGGTSSGVISNSQGYSVYGSGIAIAGGSYGINVSNSYGYSQNGYGLSIEYGSYNNTVRSSQLVSDAGSGVGVITASILNSLYDNRITGGGFSPALYIGFGAYNNLFVRNNLTGGAWVSCNALANDFNNTAGEGNIYTFANGTPAYEVYDIKSSMVGGIWADYGMDYPFTHSSIPAMWSGSGVDWHPYTQNVTLIPPSAANCSYDSNVNTGTVSSFDCWNMPPNSSCYAVFDSNGQKVVSPKDFGPDNIYLYKATDAGRLAFTVFYDDRFEFSNTYNISVICSGSGTKIATGDVTIQNFRNPVIMMQAMLWIKDNMFYLFGGFVVIFLVGVWLYMNRFFLGLK